MRFLTTVFFVSGFIALFYGGDLYAQEAEKEPYSVLQFPDKIFNAIDKKTASIEQALIKQTTKYLSKIQREENKLKKKIWQKDSILAKQMFAGMEDKYSTFRNFTRKAANLSSFYSSHTDSLSTSLSFLNNLNPGNVANSSAFQNALQHFNSLQDQFNLTDQVKKFLAERQRLLKRQFDNLGLGKLLSKFKKKVYYFRAQVSEYEELFKNSSKAEAKLIELALRIPKFKEFFARNSMLNNLFPNPGNSGPSNTTVTGLQTRAQVVSFIQNRIGAGSSQNSNPLIQSNLQSAQGQIDQLRNNLSGLGIGGSDIEMPDFKPNTQKTKSFLKRLEYGTNLQTTRGSTFFPVTSDLGLSIGYKMNDKNVLGVGASYKMGWGRNIRHINITNQGVGFRSFLDVNIRKSFFVTGGFEYNYQQPFNELSVLYNLNNWQKSGLIGMSKIISVKTKVFKKTKIQLLWDFLSYSQLPRTEAIKFRIGYSF